VASDPAAIRPATLVDSCVLLDVITGDQQWADWSAGQIAAAVDAGRVVINPLRPGFRGLEPFLMTGGRNYGSFGEKNFNDPERTVVLRCWPVRWPTARLALDQAGGDERPVVDLADDLLLPGVVLHVGSRRRRGVVERNDLGSARHPCSLSGARVDRK
jgi:hypothetical protein